VNLTGVLLYEGVVDGVKVGVGGFAEANSETYVPI
jgi:hypothetical protein